MKFLVFVKIVKEIGKVMGCGGILRWIYCGYYDLKFFLLLNLKVV